MMALGGSRRGKSIAAVIAVVAVVVILAVWFEWGSSITRKPASNTVILFERSLPTEILSSGDDQQASNWQWPIFDFNPCTNSSIPGHNCTSLAVVLFPGGYYNFSFEVNNQANIPAQVADLETNVNYSYSSVPSQYCYGGGVPQYGGPTISPHSSLMIAINLTSPMTPGNYTPDLTLVAVLGSCSANDCSWGC